MALSSAPLSPKAAPSIEQGLHWFISHPKTTALVLAVLPAPSLAVDAKWLQSSGSAQVGASGKPSHPFLL